MNEKYIYALHNLLLLGVGLSFLSFIPSAMHTWKSVHVLSKTLDIKYNVVMV